MVNVQANCIPLQKTKNLQRTSVQNGGLLLLSFLLDQRAVPERNRKLTERNCKILVKKIMVICVIVKNLFETDFLKERFSL